MPEKIRKNKSDKKTQGFARTTQKNIEKQGLVQGLTSSHFPGRAHTKANCYWLGHPPDLFFLDFLIFYKSDVCVCVSAFLFFFSFFFFLCLSIFPVLGRPDHKQVATGPPMYRTLFFPHTFLTFLQQPRVFLFLILFFLLFWPWAGQTNSK